jgi:PASTA domain
MRTTLTPLVIALALALGADSEQQEPASDPEALQERVERLEDAAKKREAEAARKVKAAERRAEAAQRKAQAARREAKRKQAQAQETADPDAAGTTAERGGDIVVPDVTGLDHQAAQDAMQGEGLWSLDEKDCTGQGRMLLFDRNWEVVSTDPPAGTRVNEDTPITICSKKQGE